MSGSDVRPALGGQEDRVGPEREDGGRPSVVLAVLAVALVVSLAAGGWLLDERQQIAVRVTKAENARLAEASEAQRLRGEISELRSANAAMVRKVDAAADRERTARQAADSAAENLRAELKQEQARNGEAAQRMHADLARARQSVKDADRSGREQVAKERAAKDLAERAAATALTDVARERQTIAQLWRDLQQAREQLAQERGAKEAVERTLEDVRTQLIGERNARRDADQDTARRARVGQPEPADMASPAQGWKLLAVSNDLLALSDFVKNHPASPESDQALRRLGELIPASDDKAALASLIERADGGPIADGARRRLATLETSETKPVAPRPITLANPGGWVTYRDPRLDFVFNYPAVIFNVEAEGANERERIFVSKDGKARLLAYSGSNPNGRTLAAYRTARLDQRYAGGLLP